MSRQFTFVSLLLWSALAACADVLPAVGITHYERLCVPGGSCSILAQSTASISLFSTVVNDNGVQLLLTGSADVSAGVMKASASYSESAQSSFWAQFASYGVWNDTVTIDSPGLAGTTGYLVVTYRVTGTATPNGTGQINLTWDDSAGNTGVLGQTRYLQGFNSPSFDSVIAFSPIAFHFGQPFAFGGAFAALNSNVAQFLSGSADFSHTATITRLATFDSNMSPVTDTTFTSALGVRYTPEGVVPEPQSLLLLGCGIAFLLILQFRGPETRRYRALRFGNRSKLGIRR